MNEIIARCVKEFGKIDYGVHCAGVRRPLRPHSSLPIFTPHFQLTLRTNTPRQKIGRQTLNPMTSASLSEYDLLYSTNVKGTVLVLGALASQMATQEIRTVTGRNGPRGVGRGSIVCLSSGNGLVGEPNKGPYVAVKHAVLGIMKTAGTFP